MIYYGQELYHHGIKGQRWGIRRYQNEDGTLTDLGKKRYNQNDGWNLTKKEIRKAREHYNKNISEKTLNDIKKMRQETDSKIDKEYIDSIDKVKKEDPEIGVNVLMSDGKMYTSRNYKNALKSGLHIRDLKWVCYGSTLMRTMDMIDTTNKYDASNTIHEMMKKHNDTVRDLASKDVYKSNTKEAKEFLKTIGL